MTRISRKISTDVRRTIMAAGIGLAILAPAYAAIESVTTPTAITSASQDGHGGSNRDHARLGTGQYSMNNPSPQMRYTSPPSGAYIGSIN